LFPDHVTDDGSQVLGNFGAIDIRGENCSGEDLVRQILHGPNNADLEPHGGKLELDAEAGTLYVGGDTGLPSEIGDALQLILGRPRTMPLYRTVNGAGSAALFEIVGFAGIRVIDVSLSNNVPRVRVQPAYVVDPQADNNGGISESYFVVTSVRLVR
jgi:hypothetical protein